MHPQRKAFVEENKHHSAIITPECPNGETEEHSILDKHDQIMEQSNFVIEE